MNNIYLKNLSSLKKKDSILAQQIDLASASDKVNWIESKSGEIVPVIHYEGRDFPLHSRIKPVEEGQRIASSYKQEGTLIFLGFGGGYHIEPFLKSCDIEHIFIVVPDLSLFKSVMQQRDLTLFIEDSRLLFLVEEEDSFIIESIQNSYVPLLSGLIQTIPLMSILRFYKDKLEGVFNALGLFVENIKADFSVQHHFGKQWFHNSIKNLKRMASVDTLNKRVLSIPSKVVITAAGPSLEQQIVEIKKDYGDRFLIASDTSVPVLLKKGIRPDLIVSIDCQLISRSHFISMNVRDIPIILDIASSGSVVDRFDYPVFCGSRHPFSQYLVDNGLDLPLLNFSGGSVTHAAIEVAHFGGADDIILAGADFAYPWGKSYARGSYLYDYFNLRANRVKPLEQGFYSLLMRTVFDRRETSSGECYVPQRMDSYKNELEALAQTLSSECLIKALEGDGQILSLPLSLIENRDSKKQSGDSKKLHNKKVFSKEELSQFLLKYIYDLEALDDLSLPLTGALAHLTGKDHSLWLTLIPYAAQFTGKFEEDSSSQMLSFAKQSAIDFIRRVI